MDEVEDKSVPANTVTTWRVAQPKRGTTHLLARTSGCTGGVTAVDMLAKPNVSFEAIVKFPARDDRSSVEMLF
jgi:hypothetical protein